MSFTKSERKWKGSPSVLLISISFAKPSTFVYKNVGYTNESGGIYLARTRVDVFNTPIPKALLKLAWPIMITQIFQIIYNMTDAFWLGKLGKVKFSAPTVSFPVIFIFMSFAFGLSSAGTALVSQHIGAKRKREAEKSAMQTLLSSFLLSMFLGLIGFFSSSWILTLLNIEEILRPYVEEYLKVIFLGLPFTFLMFSSQAVVRGWGDTVFTMRVTAISVLANAFLDPFMIFGIGFPRMEVRGAALATIISRAIAAMYSIHTMMSGKLGFRIHLEDLKPDLKIIGKIFKIGIPGAIGQAVTASGFAVVMGVISRFGPAVVSAYGVGSRISSALSMVGFAISGAVTTMVGQFLGARDIKKVDETVKWGFIETFTIVGVMALFLFLFGDLVTKFFIDDPEVVRLGETYFHLVSFSMPLFAMMSIVMGAFNGAGKTHLVAIVNVARLWGVRVPLVFWMAKLFGFNGIFYAMAISNALALLLGYAMLKLVKWKEAII